ARTTASGTAAPAAGHAAAATAAGAKLDTAAASATSSCVSASPATTAAAAGEIARSRPAVIELRPQYPRCWEYLLLKLEQRGMREVGGVKGAGNGIRQMPWTEFS